MDGKELVNETDQTFEKQHLGMKLNQTKILRLIWEKDKDLLVVEIPSESLLNEPFCNTLGIISPTTTIRKIIYRDSRISWDKALPDLILKTKVNILSIINLS